MAKVSNTRGPQSIFIALRKELVGMEYRENGVKVFEVVWPCCTVNQNVIEKDQCKLPEHRAEERLHECLKRGWGPKGIMRNL